jgi:LPXTG-motif cell wall-anchored protein
MASRRSLTTTAATAGALLAAIYFVPSASASVERPEHAHATRTAAAPGRTTALRSSSSSSSHTDLADTGSVDTTPYVVGGTAFLGMGTALLLISRRRALPYA